MAETLDPRNIKDKRIERTGLVYLATVELMDGRRINCGRHVSIRAAQQVLAQYPPDVFEGYSDPAGEAAIKLMDRARKERKKFHFVKRKRKYIPTV